MQAEGRSHKLLARSEPLKLLVGKRWDSEGPNNSAITTLKIRVQSPEEHPPFGRSFSMRFGIFPRQYHSVFIPEGPSCTRRKPELDPPRGIPTAPVTTSVNEPSGPPAVR